MKLVTSCICPPIPTRKFDWEAFDDDQHSGICGDQDCKCREGLVRGFGPTEHEAIIEWVRELLLRNDDAQEMLVNCQVGGKQEWLASLHTHSCQQCGKRLSVLCDCEKGPSLEWCSARCKAAFDL